MSFYPQFNYQAPTNPSMGSNVAPTYQQLPGQPTMSQDINASQNFAANQQSFNYAQQYQQRQQMSNMYQQAQTPQYNLPNQQNQGPQQYHQQTPYQQPRPPNNYAPNYPQGQSNLYTNPTQQGYQASVPQSGAPWSAGGYNPQQNAPSLCPKPIPPPPPMAPPSVTSKPPPPPALPSDAGNSHRSDASKNFRENAEYQKLESEKAEIKDKQQQFEVQYEKWEKDFQDWLTTNANHPDQSQLKKYSAEHENYRMKLESIRAELKQSLASVEQREKQLAEKLSSSNRYQTLSPSKPPAPKTVYSSNPTYNSNSPAATSTNSVPLGKARGGFNQKNMHDSRSSESRQSIPAAPVPRGESQRPRQNPEFSAANFSNPQPTSNYSGYFPESAATSYAPPQSTNPGANYTPFEYQADFPPPATQFAPRDGPGYSPRQRGTHPQPRGGARGGPRPRYPASLNPQPRVLKPNEGVGSNTGAYGFGGEVYSGSSGAGTVDSQTSFQGQSRNPLARNTAALRGGMNKIPNPPPPILAAKSGEDYFKPTVTSGHSNDRFKDVATSQRSADISAGVNASIGFTDDVKLNPVSDFSNFSSVASFDQNTLKNNSTNANPTKTSESSVDNLEEISSPNYKIARSVFNPINAIRGNSFNRGGPNRGGMHGGRGSAHLPRPVEDTPKPAPPKSASNPPNGSGVKLPTEKSDTSASVNLKEVSKADEERNSTAAKDSRAGEKTVKSSAERGQKGSNQVSQGSTGDMGPSGSADLDLDVIKAALKSLVPADDDEEDDIERQFKNSEMRSQQEHQSAPWTTRGVSRGTPGQSFRGSRGSIRGVGAGLDQRPTQTDSILGAFIPDMMNNRGAVSMVPAQRGGGFKRGGHQGQVLNNGRGGLHGNTGNGNVAGFGVEMGREPPVEQGEVFCDMERYETEMEYRAWYDKFGKVYYKIHGPDVDPEKDQELRWEKEFFNIDHGPDPLHPYYAKWSSKFFGSNSATSDVKSQASNSLAIDLNTPMLTDLITLPDPTELADLIEYPGRRLRAKKIVLILRGPPGSGKSFLARLIKEREVILGDVSNAPRILSIDDYYLTEEFIKKDAPSEDQRSAKLTLPSSHRNKIVQYEYDEKMEAAYNLCMLKCYKKSLENDLFNFVIVDNINHLVSDFEEYYNYAKMCGYKAYLIELKVPASVCFKRNTHRRSRKDVERIITTWEDPPEDFLCLDQTSFLEEHTEPEPVKETSSSSASKGRRISPSPQRKQPSHNEVKNRLHGAILIDSRSPSPEQVISDVKRDESPLSFRPRHWSPRSKRDPSKDVSLSDRFNPTSSKSSSRVSRSPSPVSSKRYRRSSPIKMMERQRTPSIERLLHRKVSKSPSRGDRRMNSPPSRKDKMRRIRLSGDGTQTVIEKSPLRRSRSRSSAHKRLSSSSRTRRSSRSRSPERSLHSRRR